MKTFGAVSLAIALTLASSASASATDLYAAAEPVPATMEYDDGFDWEGFYFGVYKGTEWCIVPSGCGWQQGVVGATAGYNFVLDGGLVLSAEGRLGVWYHSDDPVSLFPHAWEAFGLLRAGFLVTDDTLVYGSAGLGTYWGFDFGPTPAQGALGAGVEWAATDNLSLRADAQARACLTGGCVGSWQFNVTAGAVWHAN